MSSHEQLPSFPGEGTAREQPATADEYAPWLSRVGGYLIDGLVLFAFAYAAARLAGGNALAVHAPKRGHPNVDSTALVVLTLVDNGLVFFYSMLLLSSRWCATVGMRVANIRIETVDGTRVTLGRAAGRTAIVVAASVLALLGSFLGSLVFLAILADLLWPLWDPRRQTLHDKLAGTVVRRGRV